MEPELRLLSSRRAQRLLHRDPPERDPGERYARPGDIRTEGFDASLGLDPARVRDWFGKAVSVLDRTRTDPWIPHLVWVGRHRKKKLTTAYREIVYDLSDDGPLRQFKNFRWMVIDATHDPKFAEDLEEMWPSRAEGLFINSTVREMLLRLTWLWFRMGGAIPGKTGLPQLDADFAEARREMSRLELELTPNGKLKVDHRYNEHNDLADAIMFSLYRPMTLVRRTLGAGTRAIARPASGRAQGTDKFMDAVVGRQLPPHRFDGPPGSRRRIY